MNPVFEAFAERLVFAKADRQRSRVDCERSVPVIEKVFTLAFVAAVRVTNCGDSTRACAKQGACG